MLLQRNIMFQKECEKKTEMKLSKHLLWVYYIFMEFTLNFQFLYLRVDDLDP